MKIKIVKCRCNTRLSIRTSRPYVFVHMHLHITFQQVKQWLQNYASIAPSTYSASFVGWHHGIGCQPPALLICFQSKYAKASKSLPLETGVPHTHTHTYIYIYVQLYIYIYTHTYIHTYLLTYIHTYIYIYIYIDVHLCIY